MKTVGSAPPGPAFAFSISLVRAPDFAGKGQRQSSNLTRRPPAWPVLWVHLLQWSGVGRCLSCVELLAQVGLAEGPVRGRDAVGGDGGAVAGGDLEGQRLAP